MTRLCLKTPSSARERAVFSSGKDGEAGDVGSIVDAAGRSQADNSGCLDPPVYEKAQEKGPLEARSAFPTEPLSLCLFRPNHEIILVDFLRKVHPLEHHGMSLQS